MIAAAAMALAMGAATAAAPSFPGGNDALAEYLATNMKYPDTARNHGVEGVVHLSFTVKADGSIGTIKVLRMVDADLEQEAIRLIKEMPAWLPAETDGKPVDSTAEVDVTFSLPQE